MTVWKTPRKFVSRLHEPQHVPPEDDRVAHLLACSKNTPIIYYYYYYQLNY
jgi:hypothetical protein